LRQHLVSVWQQTGNKPNELDAFKLPALFKFVWEDFKELHKARSNNGYTENPIDYLSIEAWSRLKNITLSSNEIDIIRTLDVIYINLVRKQKAKHNGN